ncbi:hypothetical protein BD311DRAFT_534826 [Dichomitus squalens]|uniref:Uncharacterized protein n=1 Tax=Dichomitus squalens TaxID=114155 RepID=A0A4Q9MBW9_9APHY|nr:hypothetical protein BD311DRAFT_534826 [Dichomitus squalens]
MLIVDMKRLTYARRRSSLYARPATTDLMPYNAFFYSLFTCMGPGEMERSSVPATGSLSSVRSLDSNRGLVRQLCWNIGSTMQMSACAMCKLLYRITWGRPLRRQMSWNSIICVRDGGCEHRDKALKTSTAASDWCFSSARTVLPVIKVGEQPQ